MSNGQYPPPPYASPAPPYQEQHGGSPPDQAYHAGTDKKGTNKHKKIMMFVVMGFGAIFLGAFLHNLAGYFIDPGNGYDAMGFIGTFLQHTGALGSACAFIMGSLSFKDRWVRIAMILAAVILIVVFLVSALEVTIPIEVSETDQVGQIFL